MSVIVNEIFYSIQGESTHAGRPCAFVRLTGCNLRCSYCDTFYARDEGTPQEISEVIQQVDAFGCRLVEITGGEPLMQAQTPLLIRGFLDQGYEVLMETNGSLDISTAPPQCVKVMDIKCPSSNESQKNDLNNIHRLAPDDQVKFVVQNRPDYDFAKSLLPQIESRMPGDHILFSPVARHLEPRELAAWLLEDRLTARLQVQLHKLIWPETKRGV